DRPSLLRTPGTPLLSHEPERFLVMLHRLPFLSLQSQKLGETLMRSGKVSLAPQCIIKCLRCLVIPALGGVNTSQAIVSLGRFRRQPCGFLQLGNSPLDPTLPSR